MEKEVFNNFIWTDSLQFPLEIILLNHLITSIVAGVSLWSVEAPSVYAVKKVFNIIAYFSLYVSQKYSVWERKKL